MKRRIPRETAGVGLLVVAVAAVVSALIPSQLRGLNEVQAMTLAVMPLALFGAVGYSLWRSGRYALRSDEAPLLALPDAEEAHGPLRTPLRNRPPVPWRWLGLLSVLCYMAAATSFVAPAPPSPYLYSPEELLAVVPFNGGPSWFSGKFWEFLAASAIAGVLTLLAWLDEAVEP